MVISWCLLEAGPDGSGLQHPPDLFSPDEQQRLERMRFPKRRAEWMLGRSAAKRLLIRSRPELAHEVPANIEIENEPEGQPYYRVGGQRYPDCLSISHSSGLALAAVAPDGVAVGIDIEKIEARPQAFFEDYFTEAEMERLSALPAALRDTGITLVWSAKEAVLKAWGKGLRLDTRSLEIDLLDSLPPTQPGWQPLRVKARMPGLPAECTLFWQPYEEYVITLAHSAYRDERIEQVTV